MPHRWNSAAEARRRQIESGADYTFTRVFAPLYESLLRTLQPKNLLEVGCGTGHLSRMASELGISVTALEPSAGMFGEASEVLGGLPVVLLSVSVEEYREDQFDVVLTHMCAQTVERLAGFATACAERLSATGTLVCAVPHPCFYNEYKRLIPEDQYSYALESAGVVTFSITAEPKVLFEGVPYHHRPLSGYFRAFAEAGLSVHDFLEPWPTQAIQSLYGAPWKTPRYCVFVCRRFPLSANEGHA